MWFLLFVLLLLPQFGQAQSQGYGNVNLYRLGNVTLGGADVVDVGNSALRVNVVAGGGGSGTSSSFGAAFPATGTAIGFKDTSNNMAAGLLDASGNILISGTVAATQSGAWVMGQSGLWNVGLLAGTALVGKFTLSQGGNDAIVTAAGNLQVDCQVGCSGSTFTDNAAFTAGATNITNVGGVYDDGLAAVTSGNAAAPRITATRAFHINLRDNSGTEVGTAGAPLRVDPTGSTTQPVSGTVTANAGSGTFTVGGTVTSNQGTANTAANRWPIYVTDGTNTMPTMDAAARAGYQRITDGSSSASLTGTSLDVNCTGGCGAAASFADNAAFTFGTTPIGITGYVLDDVAPNTVTENSAAAPRMSANRVPYSQIRDAAGNERGVNVTAGNALVVDGSASTQPVSGTVTVTQGTASNLNAQVVGNVASGAADSGNPVKIGAVYNSTLPTVTNGQRVDLQADTQGGLRTVPYPNTVSLGTANWTTSTMTSTALTASVAGYQFVTFIVDSSGVSGNGIIRFESTIDGTNWSTQSATDISLYFGSLETFKGNWVNNGYVIFQANVTGASSFRIILSEALSAGTFDIALFGVTTGSYGIRTVTGTAVIDGNYTEVTRPTSVQTLPCLVPNSQPSYSPVAGFNLMVPCTSDTKGNQYQTIRDAAGNDRGANVTASNALVVDGSAVTQPVSGTVAATQSGNWTARVVGNTGATVDSAPDATAPTNILNVGGRFVTSPATLTTGQAGSLQLTAAQNLKTDVTTMNGVAVTMGNGVSGTGVQRVTIASDSTGQVALATGSNTIGALTANQSVNVNQIGGNAVSTGNGATGTGSIRVTLANDSSAIAGKGEGATGSAPPSGAQQMGGIASGATGGLLAAPTICDQWVAINTTASAQLITGVSGRKVYFCSGNIQMNGGANTLTIVSGTGSTCGTGTTAIPGFDGSTTAANGYSFAANSGMNWGGGLTPFARSTNNADNICILLGSATRVVGGLNFAIY